MRENSTAGVALLGIQVDFEHNAAAKFGQRGRYPLSNRGRENMDEGKEKTKVSKIFGPMGD